MPEIRHARVGGQLHPYAHVESSLAFHVRRSRQWYGHNGISQHDLALIAGVAQSSVRYAESTDSIPRNVEVLLSVAAALHCPLEEIVAPHRLAEIREAVEKRRAQLAHHQTQPSLRSIMPAGSTQPFHLAVLYRSPYLYTVLA